MEKKVAGFTPGLAQILKQSRGSVGVIRLGFSGLANCKTDSRMWLTVEKKDESGQASLNSAAKTELDRDL